MKKRTLLVTLLMAGCLTACGGGKEENVEDFYQPIPTVQEEVVVEETRAPKADSVEALEEDVSKDVEEVIGAMTQQYEELLKEVDTFENYMENADKVEGFYDEALRQTEDLCIRLRQYSIEYAELIMAMDISNDEKYDELEEIYDFLYEDMGDELYDGIYDGVMDDMYDAYYDEIIADGQDSVEYKVWADARSNEYKMWSDTRSDIYKEWSDMRSDIYGFWSDIRSEVYMDDMEEANEEIADFKEDVEKMMNGVEPTENPLPEESAVEITVTPQQEEKQPEPTKTPEAENVTDGIRPEFKAAMDSYEAFIDEYVEFMKKYLDADSSDLLGMMGDYYEYMAKYAETMAAMEAMDTDDLSEEEALYYAEVSARISKKLLEIAY